jgi:hypothetical protein
MVQLSSSGLLVNSSKSHCTTDNYIIMSIAVKGYITYIHTYHSCFIPKGVAEASQIFLQDTYYQNYLAVSNTADVTSGNPIAV